MANSNNVTAPNEGDEAKKPEKSALQTFLDGLVIPSIEFIVSIFDGTADIDNEAIEHFRSPFVYGGKDSNDLKQLDAPMEIVKEGRRLDHSTLILLTPLIGPILAQHEVLDHVHI